MEWKSDNQLFALMKHLQIGGYEIQFDRDATATAYARISVPGPEGCKCADCRNWVAGREQTVPLEVRALLSQLGIPLNGEIEVDEVPGGVKSHGYWGWYMFVGQILSKPPEVATEFHLNGFNMYFTCGLSFAVPAFEGLITCELQFITEADEYLSNRDRETEYTY